MALQVLIMMTMLQVLIMMTMQVLIPVFALGRAQELCILLETYWERMNLKCPIYFRYLGYLEYLE